MLSKVHDLCRSDNEYVCKVRHFIRRRDEKTTRSAGSSCVKKPAVLENVIGPGVSCLGWITETTLTIDDLGRAVMSRGTVRGR